MATTATTPCPANKTAPARARKQLGILGTGQFALAFARRLLTSGHSVVLGSRDPRQRRPHQLPARHGGGESQGDHGGVTVTSLEDCIVSSDVIVVALHVGHYEETFTAELSSLCGGRVLVDVSNERPPRGSTPLGSTPAPSNAHLLASLVPGAAIVKAFNSVPAYVMENDAGGRRVVTVASDDVKARAEVCVLARDLGFEPREVGGLGKAGRMEERERRVFPDWTLSVLATLVVLVFWLLFAVSRFYLADDQLSWDQLPLKVMNKVFGAATLSLLSLTYFPSTCAALLQMYHGSKHRRFPDWLDVWLKGRKQLGLAAFALISVHAMISALILSPTYMPAWFAKDVISVTVPTNVTQEAVGLVMPAGRWMTWVGELSLLAGVLSFILMALLAVTSLPSVSKALHWSEWRFLHSRLGCVMLVLAVTHVYVMGVPKWMKTGFPLVLLRVKFLSIVFPSLVLVSRLVMLLPCVSSYLRRIRQGWERKPAAERQPVPA
ncbi:metalloreductase STEAP4-like [Babylonia areolata]|uniref:metalloreductase STEAP4-like n=1 Tax=Babylonia areolata TaxID=304850 RepID=UPI003FD57315